MTRKTLISSLSALALLAAIPGSAEARFGKRGSDDDSSNGSRSSHSSSSSSKHSSSSDSSDSSSSSEHKAVPAYAPSTSAPAQSHVAHPAQPRYHEPQPRYHDSRPGHLHPAYVGYRSPSYVHYGWGFGYYPYVAAPQPAAPLAAEVVESAPGPTATLGVDAFAHGLGGSLGLNMAVEGQRWGLNGQYSSLFYASDFGGLDPSTTSLYDLRLSYALISGQHGRLRLEGGVSGVVAPDLATLGPDAGVSVALGLVGPVGVEAAAHATVLPHQRYDWNAGLTLALGHVGLRAGWKQLRLDDNGLTEQGVRYVDDFSGPYFGVGFAF